MDIVLQVFVGLVLALNTLLLLVPDTPIMKLIKSGYGGWVNVIGTGMNWVVALFADIAFVYWVS